MTDPATHIWFRTSAAIDEVAEAIGLTDATHDAEDYWEWIIGTFEGVQLDLARAHTTRATESDTRVFRFDRRPFTRELSQAICKRAILIAESDILLGYWNYLGRNEFDKIVVSRFDRDPLSG